jgi:hypothetical protein
MQLTYARIACSGVMEALGDAFGDRSVGIVGAAEEPQALATTAKATAKVRASNADTALGLDIFVLPLSPADGRQPPRRAGSVVARPDQRRLKATLAGGRI